MINVNLEVEFQKIKLELKVVETEETEFRILDILEENPILPDNPAAITNKEETYCHPNNHTYLKLFLNEIVLFGITKQHPLITENSNQENQLIY